MIITRECCAPGCKARFETEHDDRSRIYCARHEGRLQTVAPTDPDPQEATSVPTEQRDCRGCGKPFTPGHHRQAYCRGCKPAGPRRPAEPRRQAEQEPSPTRPPATLITGPVGKPPIDARLADVLKGLERWEAAKVAAGEWTDEDEALRRWVAAGA